MTILTNGTSTNKNKVLENETHKILSCLNFWDEACWFLSLKFFGLLSSSLLLFPQHFGWYVLLQVFVELGNLHGTLNYILYWNQQDTWHNGYRCWFPELLRRQSSEGCLFNPHYRRVIYRNTWHLYLVMANRIRTGDPRGFNKGRSLKFRVRQTPEEGWRTYRPKRCRNNNKDEDNSPKNLNDKKHKILLDFEILIHHSIPVKH